MELLAVSDLQGRWKYTKAGIHKLIKRDDFPKPIAAVCNGRIKVFLKADIEKYEIGKSWLFDHEQKRRRQILFGLLQEARHGEQPDESLKNIFGQHAKPWKQKTSVT